MSAPSRRLWAALTMAVLGSAALSCGQASLAATPNGAPPAWPAEVGKSVAPSGPGCSARVSGSEAADPGTWWPSSPQNLLSRSGTILVATATAQRAYWYRPPEPQVGPGPDGFVPMTATNLKVVTVIRGSGGAWIQVRQSGAMPGTLPCPGRTVYPSDFPPLVVGERYEVFVLPSTAFPPASPAPVHAAVLIGWPYGGGEVVAWPAS